jgi:hypothetical protein
MEIILYSSLIYMILVYDTSLNDRRHSSIQILMIEGITFFLARALDGECIYRALDGEYIYF